jgi:hypothetical protein
VHSYASTRTSSPGNDIILGLRLASYLHMTSHRRRRPIHHVLAERILRNKRFLEDRWLFGSVPFVKAVLAIDRVGVTVALSNSDLTGGGRGVVGGEDATLLAMCDRVAWLGGEDLLVWLSPPLPTSTPKAPAPLLAARRTIVAGFARSVDAPTALARISFVRAL